MAKEIEAKASTAAGGVQHVVPDGFYTRDMVAQIVGRSRDTIRRWTSEGGKFEPRYNMKVGKLKVWLFDDEDVEVLKGMAKTVRPGRPAMVAEDVEEKG